MFARSRGAHRAPFLHRGPNVGRGPSVLAVILFAAVFGMTLVLGAAPSPARAAVGQPKAVVIVGPGSGSTSDFLAEGELIADQAAAAGMAVSRIFHPNATWKRVKEATLGANLVVYFGHGNGWPSPYPPFQEDTKDGFGLNGYEGASQYSTTYYGGNKIRAKLRLADDAVVIIYRACYSAGNGEDGSPIPSQSVAIKRVDNFAAAFLHPDVGAGVVMAYRTKQWIDFPAGLMLPGRTMDDVFRTPSSKPSWSMSGWIGTNDIFADSVRTSGARLHLDKHPTLGYSRAISGSLGMTTDAWLLGE